MSAWSVVLQTTTCFSECALWDEYEPPSFCLSIQVNASCSNYRRVNTTEIRLIWWRKIIIVINHRWWNSLYMNRVLVLGERLELCKSWRPCRAETAKCLAQSRRIRPWKMWLPRNRWPERGSDDGGQLFESAVCRIRFKRNTNVKIININFPLKRCNNVSLIVPT